MKRLILKRHICLLAVIILININLQAQESEPMRLSPDEAVELAVKNNLSLDSSRINLATRRRSSDLSWNQFIPNVTVSGTLNRDNQAQTMSGIEAAVPTGLVGSPFFPVPPGVTLPPGADVYLSVPYSVDLPQWRVIGNLQVSLNLNAAMFENMKRLRFDYETGVLSYEKAKLQLERDVRKSYHNLLLLNENIILLRGSFENVERQVQMAQANYNAGLAPELTLLQARVARENMRPHIEQLENSFKLLMAQFAMYLGMDYNTPFELIPMTENANFIPLDISEMITKAASGKPDIHELRQTIMMLESARRMQIYALTPSLNLSWNSNSVLMGDPWKDSWFGNNSDWRKTGSLSITVALRLHSLIPFSTDFQGVRAIDDQIRTANIGLAQMINGTEIEVYNTVLALERTRINAEAQAQTVSLAEQSYRLTEQAYQAGLQDYFQVQNAEQSLRQARVQLLEQQFNYLNGLIDLEYSIGVPFGTLSKRSE
ncbi:MAG: TolC family protein [Treponema sp.]|nr:TolC family protein [Treponema sp.]